MTRASMRLERRRTSSGTIFIPPDAPSLLNWLEEVARAAGFRMYRVTWPESLPDGALAGELDHHHALRRPGVGGQVEWIVSQFGLDHILAKVPASRRDDAKTLFEWLPEE